MGIAIIGVIVFLVAATIVFASKQYHKPAKTITASSKPKFKLFSGLPKDVDSLIPSLEEKLITADVGINTTTQLIDFVRNSKPKSTDEALAALKSRINQILSFSHWSIPSTRPAVFLFVGINGVGKTTSIAKFAYFLKNKGHKTLLVAGDTFRAAAREQLETWAQRTGAEFVGSQSNADPASVIFDGIEAAKKRGIDIVLADTSGRLHNKSELMSELQKMVRSSEKSLGRKCDEIFLVLDSTTGQNGLNQALAFKEAVAATGIILTKYDGTAKGGIVLAIASETGLPIRFVGIGEKMENMIPFNTQDFVESLFE